MNKTDVIKKILKNKYHKMPQHDSGSAFAPANIALCKYWGKRDTELNLPMTSSLSISLGLKGAETKVTLIDSSVDKIFVNDEEISFKTTFAKRLIEYLDLIRPNTQIHFLVETTTNLPISAGLASSACGFAALIKALNELFVWQLEEKFLSVMARLGSGSASRSLQHGFVKWNKGKRKDGMDSYAVQLPLEWHDLKVGLLMLSTKPKEITSREAMQRTVATSPLYKNWPNLVNNDIKKIEQAIVTKDFPCFGKIAEANAMCMHALMQTAWPPILYARPETITMMNKVWQLREEGLPIYFTQDAGPNLKLLFLASYADEIGECFPDVEIIEPF